MTRLKLIRYSATLAILAIGPVIASLMGPRLAARFQARGTSNSGFPAADFALKSVEGQEYSLSGQRGRPVVVTSVASWCEVCRQEMPMMVETFRAHTQH